MEEQCYKINHIYDFAKNYLVSWFLKLKSYVAFCTRLNRLSAALKILCNTVIHGFIPIECSKEFSLLDSMPIITCGGKRTRKVAIEITDKSFCSTKNLWYYGVKLQALNHYKKKGTL